MSHKKIDTRVPDELHDLVSAYAAQNNLSRSQVVVAALKQFFGMAPSNPVDFARNKIFPMPLEHSSLKIAEELGASMTDPSEESAGGSSPAKTQIRYPAKKRAK